MKSETREIKEIFQDRRQYRVPFYQRAYVWNEEDQWEPLWNDIQDKAESILSGSKPNPHFLGAIVLEPQIRSGLKGVESYHIIDGQQRLTTLQYFLASLYMIARERGYTSIAPLLQNCVWNNNPETMENPATECFKLWPTFRDRTSFQGVMKAENRLELKREFPTSFTQSGGMRRIGIEHPPSLAALWFFCEKIQQWIDTNTEEGLGSEKKLEIISEAILRHLKIVAITLEEQDEAQVIFETLNGRGAALNATDLIRNYIFMRADKETVSSSELYDNLWSPFESSFWSEEQRRGRLKRPRLEWFMQISLQSKTGQPVEISRLYGDYKKYTVANGQTISAQVQLNSLNKSADHYKEMIGGTGDSPIAHFGRRLAHWDASPTHALALKISEFVEDTYQQKEMFDSITSYIVRRAFCGLTTKNYNNVFFQILRKIKNSTTSREFNEILSSQQGEASRWPRDEEFRMAWLDHSAHLRLGDVSRLRTVLVEIENGLRSPRSEERFVPQGNLDVDHILPEKWTTHWLLDRVKIDPAEVEKISWSTFGREDLSEREKAIVRREKLKSTIGNLTLVHYGVNRQLQNYEFERKRKAFFAESNLHLNRDLMITDVWSESSILARGQKLFELAVILWRSPDLPTGATETYRKL